MFHGVVLAGGQSSRMGTDKAGLPWHGRTLLEHMRNLLEQVGADRVLVSGPYAAPDGMPDHQPGLGPLGGLLTLARTQADGVYLLVPVDMPLLNTSLLQPLVVAVVGCGGTACATWAEHVLPLCLRLDAATRNTLATLALQPRQARSLRALQRMLGGIELPLAAGDASRLINCNTPEDWRGVTA